MAKGNIRCIGSPLELKNRFGVGYHFAFVKNQSVTGAETLIAEAISSHFGMLLLQQHQQQQ
jgi:hypothetical protein